MTIQISSEKIIQIFDENINTDLTFSGWEWEINYFLWIPYIVYSKPLIK